MRMLRLAALGSVLLALAGCASVKSVPAGPMSVGNAHVTLGRQWSDISALMLVSGKVKLLTIDGPLLNRLYVSDGLLPGEALVEAEPQPMARANMSVTERMEFVADNVAAMKYQRVETVRPRPATYNGQPAVRFDITARTTEGLDVMGTALAAEVSGRTYVVLYLAPAEHYFSANLAEVEQVMASARPGA